MAVLAYPNGQHHSSCALRPLLSKIKVARTRALPYLHSRDDNQEGYSVAMGREHIQPGCPVRRDDAPAGV